MLVTMIDIKKALNKLLRDLEDSSPNLKNALQEIGPITFLLNINGHKNIYIIINGDDSDISFKEKNYAFEIRASLIDVIKVLVSGKLSRNLIHGDAEIAIVLLGIIYKSNIDIIYLIDKYFGSLPAVFTYAIVSRMFNSSKIYEDKNHRKLRKRLRDIAIKLDRLEALRSS